MSNTDTNQAGEDEQTKAIYEAMQIPYLSERHDAIKDLIRTEKLKLLAEVRDLVIGEDVVLDGWEIPVYEEEFVITSVTQQNHLRADQRIELTKLEAEL